jgi:hypothetical protein
MSTIDLSLYSAIDFVIVICYIQNTIIREFVSIQAYHYFLNKITNKTK